MDSQTLDEPSKNPSGEKVDPMIYIRTGIFLYLAIVETALTLNLLIREALIISGIKPVKLILWSEISTSLIIILISPLAVKYVRKKVQQGEKQAMRLLRNVTLIFILTILVTLFNNYVLVDFFPYSYSTNLAILDNYICKNPGAYWYSYWFMIFNAAIIGAFFARKSEN